MPKVDCIKLLRQAGIVSDTEAKQLLSKMENLARERAASRGQSFENAMQDIAGELQLRDKNKLAIQRRNELDSLQKIQWGKDFAKRFNKWGDGTWALLVGSKKGVQGAGFGVDQIHVGLNGRFLSRFVAELEQAGAFEDFTAGRYAKEFYLESEALGKEGGGTATDNKSAQAVAKSWEGVRKELVSMANARGAWIEDMPGYVLAQTHSREMLVNLNPKDMNDAFRQWREAVLNGNIKLDYEKTFGGSDPEKSLREMFKNMYTGNHESYLDTFNPDTFKAHGALASKLSSPRVLWFADAESAFNYNELFGMRDYNKAIMFHIRNMTKNIALMEKLGPNPVGNYQRLLEELQQDVKLEDRADADAQVKSLDIDKHMRLMDTVTGKIDIPHNPSLARWFGLARAFRLLSTGGKMVLSSFGDKPFMQSQMTYLGMSRMDAFGKAMTGTFQSGRTAQETLTTLGMVSQSLTGHIASRWGFDLRSNYQAQQATGKFMKWIGMDWWTDVNQATMADATVNMFANHSHLPMEALPEELGRALNSVDLKPKEWDAIRKTAYAVEEGPIAGHNVITSDAFSNVPESTLKSMAVDRGVQPSPANLKRELEGLRQKYESLLVESVYTGVPTPGAREKYITTWGGRAQAGTIHGEIARSVMMYKSFATTVGMKVLGREINGGGDATNAREWLGLAYKAKFRIASLIASATIAGYAGMTAKDLLAGKTPKPLMVDGHPNLDVLMASMTTGGALGIYGDFLFSEYEARHRSVLGALAGPVLGQLDPLSETAGKIAGKIAQGETTGYDLFRLGEQNLPYAGMFYIKPVLDYFLFWNIKEMLSPGVMRRTERAAHDHNHQEYWISPAGAASIPISRPDEKLDYFLETLRE